MTPVAAEQTWMFKAHASAPHAEPAAALPLDMVAWWDGDHRHRPGPRYTAQPAGVTPADDGRVRLVVGRRHATTAGTPRPPSRGRPPRRRHRERGIGAGGDPRQLG